MNVRAPPLQVFVSIQALILVPHPYFNEPGCEAMMGTPQGDAASAQYSEEIRVATARWAVCDAIAHPPPALEDVVAAHFALRRAHVLEVLDTWLREPAAASDRGCARGAAAVAMAGPRQRRALLDVQAAVVQVLAGVEVPRAVALAPAPSPAAAAAAAGASGGGGVSIDADAASMAHLRAVLPGVPDALLEHALRIAGGDADAACGWLLEEGRGPDAGAGTAAAAAAAGRGGPRDFE
jgi:hypothetical protein